MKHSEIQNGTNLIAQISVRENYFAKNNKAESLEKRSCLF
jgi:hypothetical protein